MTRGDIADHLGLTIHTVSRTISGFVRQGLIELEGPQSCRLLDLDGLRAIAGDEAGVAIGKMGAMRMPRCFAGQAIGAWASYRLRPRCAILGSEERAGGKEGGRTGVSRW